MTLTVNPAPALVLEPRKKYKIRRRACPPGPTQFYTDSAGIKHPGTKKGPGKGIKATQSRAQARKNAAWRLKEWAGKAKKAQE